MKVAFRKSDSAASLLLFVYNNLLTYYEKDVLKLSSLLDIMKPFGKSETALRMSLSRTVKAGLLENKSDEGEVYYGLTQEGKGAIDFWNKRSGLIWERYRLRNTPWDSKWHMLYFEIGEEQKGNKAIIVERLSQLGFRALGPGTWISPYVQPGKVADIVKDYSLDSEIVEMFGQIAFHQTTEIFLERVFNLQHLEQPYNDFVRTFREKLSQIKSANKTEQNVNKGQALPLLHALGWQYFNIAAQDAMLPKEIYPEWIGDEAARLMIEYREILINMVLEYLAKFD